MTETITLKELCEELKIHPRLARMKLREAAKDTEKYPVLGKIHKPRTQWRWLKGSPEDKSVREAVT